MLPRYRIVLLAGLALFLAVSPPSFAKDDSTTAILNDSTGAWNDISRLPYRSADSLIDLFYTYPDVPYQRAYYINGLYATNQSNGTVAGAISPFALSSANYYPGGFPPRFGHSYSGIASIHAPTAGSLLSGSIEGITDNALGSGFDRNWYAARLASEPIFGLRLSGMIERRYFDQYVHSSLEDESFAGNVDRLPSNNRQGWTYQGRGDYGISGRTNLTLYGEAVEKQGYHYDHAYLFNADHMPWFEDKNRFFSAQLRHDVSDRIDLSIALSYAGFETFVGDGVHREDLLAYNQTSGNPSYSSRALFWRPGHVFNSYYKYKQERLSALMETKLRLLKNHTSVAGLEFHRYTVRKFQHYHPVFILFPGGFLDTDRYGYDSLGNKIKDENGTNSAKHPTDLAFYLEDGFESGSVAIRAGIRIERFDYDASQFRNAANPLDPDDRQDAQAQTLEPEDLKASEVF